MERHEKGVALDLTTTEPPPVEPPPGVEIVTWADRPELARGLFEISLDASPDVPGYEDEEHEPFEAWLAHDMQGPATGRRRPSSRSPATRRSVTRSSPSPAPTAGAPSTT